MRNRSDDAVISLKNIIWGTTKSKILIVEGGSDSKLFRQFFIEEDFLILNPKMVSQMVSNNKGVVIDVIVVIEENMEEISSQGKNLIGIIDADFNRITGNLRNDLQDLFYTDTHDIDSMIFSTDALKKFIYWHYKDSQNVDIEKLRQKCFEIASEFGLYLLSFYDNDLHHKKKRFKPIERYFDEHHNFLHLKVKESLDDIFRENTPDIIRIEQDYERRKEQNIDQYQMANGHDLVRVFIMLTLWGKMNLKEKWVPDNNAENRKPLRDRLIKHCENVLRSLYIYDFFRNSNLYKQIRVYEQIKRIQFLKP